MKMRTPIITLQHIIERCGGDKILVKARKQRSTLSPCITCVQYRGGVQYRGVFSTMGDIMMHVGDILSTVGMFSTVGES